MIKDLTAVTVVLIIAVAILLYTWTDRRRKTRRTDLRNAHVQRELADSALREIRNELTLQDQANRTDLYAFHVILNSYDVEKDKLAK